jgi:putative Mn2+ efflux pump MntP
MSLITIFLLAIALGVDAFSVAIAAGAASGQRTWRPVLRLSFAFGFFQFIMPLLGWLAGTTIADLIYKYAHLAAFVLLAAVGGKLIYDGFSKNEPRQKADLTRGWPLLGLSVATSIDALAAGLSISLLKNPILLPSVVIGVVCFVMTAVGMIFGKALARLLGYKVDVAGGLVLIIIAIKILVEQGL